MPISEERLRILMTNNAESKRETNNGIYRNAEDFEKEMQTEFGA